MHKGIVPADTTYLRVKLKLFVYYTIRTIGLVDNGMISDA